MQQAIPFLKEGTPAEKDLRTKILKDFSTEKYVADYIDHLELGEGELIVSAANAYAIMTASQNQKQFVIQSDLDYVEMLNSPAEHGVRYILAAPPKDGVLTDPISLYYPELYDTGSHIATLDMEFPNQGESQPDWRLFRVLNVPATP